jgi:DNA end-binding protein Ku
VRNQLFCPFCEVVIDRDETVRGYELTKGQYVRVEDAELEALEAEANSSIDLREFIPIEKVDPIYFESSYYLAPDKGADKPYRLLADTMEKTGRVALAQTVFHNKESLVLIRSVKRGLVLHFLFFKNEIRDFDAIAKGDGVKATSEELKLGRGLIEKMSSADFEPELYVDEYRERALAMIEKKVEGQEIKAVASAPRRTGQVVDIFAALKKSLETAGQQKPTAERGKRKRTA